MHETDGARSPWRIYGLIAGAVALATLNFSLVFVAFGDISDSFDASPSTVSWTLTAFSITTAAVFVPAGWMADRFGRANVFLAGFAIFIVGSGLVAAAPSVEFLIAARVVQALGLGIESPASLALVLDAFPESRRSTAVGAMGAVGGVATAIGPAVGGALVDAFTWRWAFFLNVPLGIVLLALVAPRLPRPPLAPRGDANVPDVVGVATLMAGVAALVLGIVQSDDWGYLDPRTLATLALAVALLTVLVRRSAVHPEPILHLPLFQDHDFRLGSLLSFLVAGNFAGTFLAFIEFMRLGWDFTLLQAGLAAGMIPAIAGPMSIVSGRFADRYGHRSVILPGALLMASAGVLMFTQASADARFWSLWVPFVVIYGVGVGLAHAACQSAALASVPRDRLGVGGAMARIFQDVGQAISAALVVALLARSVDVVDGLRSAMILMIVVSLLGAPAAAGLRARGSNALAS